MPRNSGGTYSLPALNPVTTGTTISSTWANNTLSDVASEITNSLDRTGQGAMLAPLQLPNGTNSAPSLTFSSETNSGLYRAGAGDIRIQVAATHIVTFAAATVTVPVGLTVTQDTTDGAGLTSTGNGAGAGVVATGGATSAPGGSFTGGAGGVGVVAQGGSGNTRGVSATASGNAQGVVGTGAVGIEGVATTHEGVKGTGAPSTTGSGGVAWAGGKFVGGTGGGKGVQGIGTGTGGVGGEFYAGVDSTAAAPTYAVTCGNGNIALNGTSPNSNVGFTNAVTPKNVVKAWGRIAVDGSGVVSIVDGFNLASAAVVGGSTTSLRVTLVNAMANANYALVFAGASATAGGTHLFPVETGNGRTTSSFVVQGFAPGSSAAIDWAAAGNKEFSFAVLGAQ